MPPVIAMSAWQLVRWLVTFLTIGIITGLVLPQLIPGPENPVPVMRHVTFGQKGGTS